MRESFQDDIKDSNALEVDAVEDKLIETFLALALKLPLDDFKPMFYRLFNSSMNDDPSAGAKYVDGLTSVFRITGAIARRLKSLFGFVAENVVQQATKILNTFSKDTFAICEQIMKAEGENFARNDSANEKDLVVLVTSIFDAISAIFSFNRLDDSEGSPNSGGQIQLQMKAYEDHVNAILNYFEAPFNEAKKEDDQFVETMYDTMEVCVGHLASSTDDETQWKYLNYQVLLYVRHNSYKIRLRVLQIVSIFLDKKGENYLAVLPDSVPLMAEALEDDDPRVEKECKKLLKKMEEIFGHSVENYFE